MKKVVMLIAIMLVLPLIGNTSLAAEAENAKMSITNSEIRSGEILSTILYINGDNLRGFTCELEYDENALSLTGAAPLDSNNTSLSVNGNKVLFYYSDGMAPDKVAAVSFSFKVSETVKTDRRLIITAKNITVSDGNTDTKYENAVCGIKVMPQKSDNADISSLEVLNGTLSPSFTSNITHYDVIIPFTETELKLNITRSPSSKCEYYGNINLTVGKNEVIIRITAENGKQQDYILSVTREQDPDYIKSDNSHLNEIVLSSGNVSPMFDPSTTDYIVYVANEINNITIAGIPQHNLATCESKTFVLSSGSNFCNIICTAEDGITTTTYRINVYRMPPYSGEPPVINPTPTPPSSTASPDTHVSDHSGFTLTLLIIAIVVIIGLCGGILFYMRSGKH